MKKVSLMKIKKLATYVKKNLTLMMMMVMKSKIIVITMENLKELLIVLVI